MVKKDDPLRPYTFHGVDLDVGRKQATGDCPWCGKEDKFSVEVESGKWRCFVCGEKGNVLTFMRMLYERGHKEGLLDLADDRKIGVETLDRWGLVSCPVTGAWLLPGYNSRGRLVQLYRWGKVKGRRVLLSTPGMGHCLFGMHLFNPKCSTVYLCEGPWDGMVLWETLARVKEGWMATANEKFSLLGFCSVLAVPGCSTFLPGWVELFRGKTVHLFYDSDHPRKGPRGGSVIPPAGLEGMKRVARLLLKSRTPPTSVFYTHWGDDGYDPDLPSGYDLRDEFMSRSV